jgi:hypothetical protein
LSGLLHFVCHAVDEVERNSLQIAVWKCNCCGKTKYYNVKNTCLDNVAVFTLVKHSRFKFKTCKFIVMVNTDFFLCFKGSARLLSYFAEMRVRRLNHLCVAPDIPNSWQARYTPKPRLLVQARPQNYQ